MQVRGYLWPNHRKRSEKSPDMRGVGRDEDERKWDLVAWVKHRKGNEKAKYLSVRATLIPTDAEVERGRAEQPPSPPVIDS